MIGNTPKGRTIAEVYLMKRFLLISLALLLSVLAVGSTLATALSVAAESAEIISPTLILDYTTKSAQNSVYTTSFRQTVAEGEYTTLNASWHDPQGELTSAPGMAVKDIRYTVITYRTSKSCKGEFYLSRSDIPTMGQSGTHSTWNWNASGEWETIVIENTAWANAADDVTIKVLRFDPLQEGVEAGDEIDVKFIAFFATREEAEAFDFDAYKASQTPPETEAPTEPVTRPEPDEPYEWPNPDYSESDTNWLDNYDGTLKYETSEDGSTVTISYQVNGETVSYTVPNQNNYLFGGYAAVDDLGRPLYDSGEVGSYTEDRQIGLFYFLWHDEDHDQGLYDLQKILDELGREGAANMSSGRYGGLGVSHWFAEPLYGYYYINDEWILRKHVELLTNAGVDFLFFDVTNAETYIPTATKLMSVLHEYNEMGYDAPQVVFYTNTNYAGVVAELQREIYRKDIYPDTWYMLNGRPVIIAPTSVGSAKFTYMATQWPNDETKHENAWPWMDFEWPQRIYVNSKGAPHAVNVSIAQHSGTVCFTDSSLYNNASNRGRSFSNPDGVSSSQSRFDRVLRLAYQAWKEDPSLTNYGLNFQAQWENALASDAPLILVTGWNEWVAQRQPSNNGSIVFVDTASAEFSRDTEMMRGGTIEFEM